MPADAASPAFPFAVGDDDEVALAIVELGVARAFWEGVPAARLLARTRLDRDDRDLVAVDPAIRESGMDLTESSWDTLMASLTTGAPELHERVKRSVARHTRAASDEGPLAASDAAIAALVVALLSSSDADASPAEAVADGQLAPESVRLAAARFDERLGAPSADPRAAPFEACLQIATQAAAEPQPLGLLVRALDAAADPPGTRALVASVSPLYPWGDREVPLAERRACLLERADLERALSRPERSARDGAVEHVIKGARALLARRGALLAIAVSEPRSQSEAPVVPPSSWLPSDFSAGDVAKVAMALEQGSTTAARARGVLLRGGHQALDGVGKEMLEVQAHPFASSVFAELLATAGRDRDVVRLVTYFAIAPDPAPAARALAMCSAPELPSVLRGWLESMLPPSGGLAPPGQGEESSTSARLSSCIAALAPYPRLHAVVSPLLARVSRRSS